MSERGLTSHLERREGIRKSLHPGGGEEAEQSSSAEDRQRILGNVNSYTPLASREPQAD